MKSRFSRALLVCAAVLFALTITPRADNTAQPLPASQDWSNTGLITADDNWTGVPGIAGYRGDGLASATGVDPQTIVADGSAVIDVNANQASPNTFATGGVTEFHLANPVVALQGSGTARAPHLVITVSTLGKSNVQILYNLRDVDGSADNSVQPVALQYRIGTSGNYTNVPAGFVADASSGPSLATLVTPVTANLPAAVANQPVVQIRILTTDAVGSDEWIGVDDISITASDVPPTDNAPAVSGTTPAPSASHVAVNSSVVINFNESVDATASAFAIQCPVGSPQLFSSSASSGSTFTLTPVSPLPYSTTCTVTVAAGQIADSDSDDPPDQMESDFAFTFTTADPAPPAAANVIINEIDADTPGADTAEFVELFDGGVGNTSLDGLVLVFYNGSNDLSYAAFDLDGFFTDANGYFTLGNAPGSGFVFAGNLLQNGADAVALYAGDASSFPANTSVTTANLRDAIVYDTDDADDSGLLSLLNAGQPQVNENGGGSGDTQSVQRCPNGSGGARNTSTYAQGTPTPGGANTCAPPPTPSNSAIVISQVYGGGGNAGATYHNDYVELYNRGTTPVDTGGWSLQYASATGSAWDFSKQPLGGTIAPGQYYLIALASGGEDGTSLPPAQINGQINMSGTSGKLALVKSFDGLTGNCPISDPHVMDFVGYGSADCREGTTTAPSPGNTTAIFRADGGNTDTDRNGSDFVTGAPAPRQTAPIVELGPLVLGTDPRTNGANAPRDATIAVTFTEAVDVTQSWIDVSCAGSGPHNSATSAGGGQTQYLTPNDNFLPGELCTVTIFKGQVFDQDSDDSGPDTDTLPANYVWTFTVATGTAPPYPPSVHLTMGNPSGAVASISQPNNYLMEKPEFALSYSRDLGRPNWVSWHLSDDWIGSLTRVDTFRPDPAVPPDWYRVQAFDFTDSGFDRGHMVPNADRDKETSIPINQATFLMSNMVAQAPDNNQGPWASFENYLRTLLPADEIYLVAGGVGAGGSGSNGDVTMSLADGHVTVPAYTWKAALVIPKAGGDDISRVSCSSRTIAVIMPNTQGIRNDPWESFLTTVDAIETVTGYNLFSSLPEPIQRCVEAGTNGSNPDLVKGDQTITFDALANRTDVDPPFTVSATGGDSGNPVTFTASGACTSGGLNGATITIVSPGLCTITASQAGSDLYNAAVDVVRTLTVVDTTAPVISSLTATPRVLRPANHKMIDVLVAYEATDVSGAPSCSLSVSSNEAPNGPRDGNTSVDWQVLDAHHLRLRAERSDSGNGRLYTITVSCRDASGNQSTGTTSVAVPK
jgi:DNA/RNA endonuclease G (NUC1)